MNAPSRTPPQSADATATVDSVGDKDLEIDTGGGGSASFSQPGGVGGAVGAGAGGRGLRGVMRPGRIGLRAFEGGLGRPRQSAEPPPDGARPVGGKGYSSGAGAATYGGDGGDDWEDFASPRARAQARKADPYGAGRESGESERLKQDEEDLAWCKLYFHLGLFALPLVHFINVWYFWRVLFDASAGAGDAHPLTKDYVKYSLCAGLCWTIIIVAWFATFMRRFKENEKLNIINTRITHLFV